MTENSDLNEYQSESTLPISSTQFPARQNRHPLGWPGGSVRALLTIIIVLFICYQTAVGASVKLLWTETLMIVLAHYFASRRFVPISDELKRQLEQEGAIESDARPLYLPRHSVRFLIVAAFAGLGVYLYRRNRLFEPQALEILGTVGAYFLGIGFRVVWGWFRGDAAPSAFVQDAKALLTIGVIVATVVIQLFHLGPRLPFPADWIEDATLGLVLFYFGSR